MIEVQSFSKSSTFKSHLPFSQDRAELKFVFRSDFRETMTAFRGKWYMVFPKIRSRFNFEISSTETFIPFSLKIGSRGFVPGGGGRGLLKRCLSREVRPRRSNPDPV